MDANNNKSEIKSAYKKNYQKLIFEEFDSSSVIKSDNIRINLDSNDTDHIWNSYNLIESSVSKIIGYLVRTQQ